MVMGKNNKILMIDSLIGNDYTLSLGLGLAEQGTRVEFIVPENREFNQPVPFHVKKWAPAKDNSYSRIQKIFKYIMYLIRLFFYSISGKKILHFQFFRRKADFILFVLLKLSGVKLVYTAHNILPHERSKSDRFIQSLVYKSAAAIIVHSAYIKNKLLNNFNINGTKVHVIPHGNFDIYIPENRVTKTNARKALNLKQDDKVLLFFGYIREYKGLDILLDAFDKAKDCDADLKLIIAGMPYNNELKSRYIERITAIDAGERIITHFSFIPSDEVQNYFEGCDIVMLPYKAIDHSGIIHLAYSFCRPVIVSAVGDFPETVEDGKSGLVFNEYTPEKLSEIILSAVKDKSELEKMGAYAKHLNDTKYSWVDIGKQTTEVYRRL
jgi:glycosyltransferase involved in cell wall biosynthesis